MLVYFIISILKLSRASIKLVNIYKTIRTIVINLNSSKLKNSASKPIVYYSNLFRLYKI